LTSLTDLHYFKNHLVYVYFAAYNVLLCFYVDFEADYKYITVSPVLLYSDGVLMKNFQNISITVYADPKIKVYQ